MTTWRQHIHADRHSVRVLVVAGAAFVLLLTVMHARLGAQTARLYVGVERCKTCHEYQYQVWKNSPHSRATAQLNEKQRQDKRCTQCHMTQTPTGGSGDTIENITCERCHGPGRYYSKKYVMRDKELAALVGLVSSPSEKECMECHSEGAPNMRPFTFDSGWAQIDHRRPDKGSTATRN